MINFNQAIAIAQAYLNDLQRDVGISMQIVKTREEPFGWIFFYQSKDYIDNENFSAMLAGNAPFIVDKERANVHVLGTAHPVDFYVEEYVRQRA
jgi:hypothetical protein